MAMLFHCINTNPEGNAILASAFREANGTEASWLFAATHLAKALVYAFNYHDREVLMNMSVENFPNEIVILLGGQKTLDKERTIHVFSFSDEGFVEIPNARQAVSKTPVPFSQTTKIIEIRDIEDIMRRGLQIFLLPEDMDSYLENKTESSIIAMVSDMSRDPKKVQLFMNQFMARWINLERGIGVCPVLSRDFPSAFGVKGFTKDF